MLESLNVPVGKQRLSVDESGLAFRSNRREFLKCALTATGALALGGTLRAEEKKKIPIGLQLYSVRNECKKELFPATIAAIAKIGYKGVELAGNYGRNPDELRKILDDNGLLCCGSHTGWGSINGDSLKGTIEANKIMGNQFLIVPGGLPKTAYVSVEGCKEIAKIFNEQSAKSREAGMYVGYHAHDADFKVIDGRPFWDILFSNTGKDVVMQIDVAHCISGGGDPYATLKRFPGRALTIHLRDHGGASQEADIGDGAVRWKELFELCETVGGTQWYIAEPVTNGNQIDSARACFESLKKMGKA